MNSKVIAFGSIGILLILGVGVWYFDSRDKAQNQKTQDQEQKLVLDTTTVYFSEDKRGELTLSSTDAKTETTKEEDLSCFAPTPGKKKYSGNFTLEFQGQKLPIGEMEFVENTPHGGKLTIEKLTQGNDWDYILLNQYANCNGSSIRIYGYDEKSEQLVQYMFKLKDGTRIAEIYGNLPPDFRADYGDDFFSTAYDQERGEYRTQWRLNAGQNLFEEVSS